MMRILLVFGLLTCGCHASDTQSIVPRAIEAAEAGDHIRAIELLTEAIEEDPGSAFAHFKRGNSFRLLGRYEEAILDYSRAMELQPGIPDSWVNRGICHDELGKYDRARSDYDTALERGGGRQALICRALLEITLGNFEAAETDARRVIELYSEHPSGYACLGWAHLESGEYEQAAQQYSEAIVREPDDADHYLNRGIARSRLGLIDQALADYSRSLELSPHADTHCMRAVALVGRDPQAAFADFAAALKLDPNHVESYVERSLLHRDHGDFESALSDSDQALRLRPNDTSVLNARATIYGVRGDHREAVRWCTRAIEADTEGDNWYPWVNRSFYREALGEEEKAAADRNQARKLGWVDATEPK